MLQLQYSVHLQLFSARSGFGVQRGEALRQEKSCFLVRPFSLFRIGKHPLRIVNFCGPPVGWHATEGPSVWPRTLLRLLNAKNVYLVKPTWCGQAVEMEPLASDRGSYVPCQDQVAWARTLFCDLQCKGALPKVKRWMLAGPAYSAPNTVWSSPTPNERVPNADTFGTCSEYV